MDNIKTCNICIKSKDISNFQKYKVKDGTIKWINNCKDCKSLDRKMLRSKLRKQNPTCNHCNKNLTQDNWYKSHQKNSVYTCQECHKNLESQSFDNHKNGKLKKYNITYQDYMNLYKNQNGKCKI